MQTSDICYRDAWIYGCPLFVTGPPGTESARRAGVADGCVIIKVNIHEIALYVAESCGPTSVRKP